jgi:epoxide hydrolase-like predicted phosphatase
MASPYGLRALVVDYGGVLTTSVNSSFDEWASQEALDLQVLAAALGGLLREDAPANLVHALERGELAAPEFERRFAALLRRADGADVPAADLLKRAFAGLGTAYPMVAAVKTARRSGFATALLSNSWGLDYDRSGWDELFDAIVLSGEVGLRKPEQAIYELMAERLGLRPQECLFVDDLSQNVMGAVAAGMVAVHHTDLEATLGELETLLGVPLRG